ncbi:MAG: AmmeMemoRadiSam system protein A [Clostridia bacterium]|nr:AmmeMemoRadiSam system protein A [Clostridia bacterium]
MPLLGAFIVPHPPLIVPEVGRGREKDIYRTRAAYEEVARRIAALRPQTIIIPTPHSILYADYLHISPGSHAAGSLRDFGAGKINFCPDYDDELARRLAAIAEAKGIPAGLLGERQPELDHGVMVPLYFINEQYRDYRLMRIGLSGLSPLSHYRFGKCIAQAVEQSGRRVVLVASGDLSHKLRPDGPYGYAEQGPQFDQEVTEAMAAGDFLRFLTFREEFCEAAAECGLRSFIIMAGALDGRAVRSELLSYEGITGVGYAVAAFTPGEADESRRFDLIFEQQEDLRLQAIRGQEDPWVRLARQALEYYLSHGNLLPRPKDLPDELTQEKAGVFVSLKLEGRLRGCIGTISPATASVADEIIQNAVSAATADPRFERVDLAELPRITLSVDVLGPAEPIDSPRQLDPKRYGVIVSCGGRRGLLLPHLEGVDTAEQQIDIALKKAGLGRRDQYKLERFEVVRHY